MPNGLNGRPTRFNTAVFYDIENLLKGYAFSAQTLSNLSLREVLDSVIETGRLSGIAVQRAYANWSDPRLAVMRGEINELGIDPIQVFGFSRDPRKNAADIQLAIDAIDLAHTRPAIEVFVIVSGDGGFSSLAKKLHEYGRVVVGCAYETATNRTFQAVCDEFVSIADPDDGRESSPTPRPSGQPVATAPLVVRMARSIRPSNPETREDLVAKVKEVLAWIGSDADARATLNKEGVRLSVIGEAIRYAIPGFEVSKTGFAKLIDLLQYACIGTNLCLIRFMHGEAALANRSKTYPGGTIVDDIGADYFDSPEHYRTVLAIGAPSIRLPEPATLMRVAQHLAENAPSENDLGTLVEEIVTTLEGSVTSEAVKQALLSLLNVGMFQRNPEGAALADQRLTFTPHTPTPGGILGELRTAAHEKLERVAGTVHPDAFDQLLPSIET